MSLLTLLVLLSAAPTPPGEAAEIPRPPYRLVMLDGRTLPLVEAPRWAFGQATVTVAGGRRLELRWRQVDQEATARLNPEPKATVPAKVWTEADLSALQRETLNVTGAPVADSGSQTAPAETVLASKPNRADEAAWRGRATPLRREIAQLEAQLQALERAKDSWEAFTLGTGDYQAAAAQELGKIRRAREAAESRLDRARGDWSRLEEDARKQGALPGWLR